MEIKRIVEGKNHGGLDDWFKKEKWVDVSRPKKKGKGFEACGRGDTSKGKKPVCTPANKAKNLSDRERKNRIRQKRKKERDPNPDKKPNVTKYTEQAGGKSNVSNTSRFRIVTSNESPRFVKVALMGEEDEERTSDLSKYFNDIDAIVQEMTRAITVGSLMSVTESIEPGLTGPGDPFTGKDTSAPDILQKLPDANQDEMTEREYLRYVRFAVKARNNLYEKAVKNQDAKMAEIALMLRKNNINPFNFGDVSGVVREVLEKRMK
ncbi:MAG: hypothetical protein K9G65_05715 [Rickettsiaceae bacterium]|nr:hypothetical protein [Rickettsiaceae bacterium]